VGAALLGDGFETAAKSKKGKNAKTCFGTKSCPFPSDGQEFRACNLAGLSADDCNGCDFRGADLGNADFSEVSVQGASFRGANLRNAFFDFADASGASFRDACLVGADFFGANLDGASLRGAILCNTTLPNGRISNRGCGKVTKCCPGAAPIECTKDTDCPSGQICVDNQCVDNPSPGCAGQTCGNFVSCNENELCACTSVAEGGGFCTTDQPCAGLLDRPGGSSDCPRGQLCLVNTCCLRPVCVDSSRLCPAPGTSRNSRARIKGSSLFSRAS
jgi:Pentapeptide repeats (8 copies)